MTSKKQIKKTNPADMHVSAPVTPHRVAPRLEGVVKNAGIKEEKKPKKK